jgi:pimeloyl-ACP methyl ester carboxylesterase
VHGLSRNARDFDRLAEALQPDCRVVCMDVVGRGASDWLEDKAGYCFPTYLSDAAALIARLSMPPPPGLLGQMRTRLLGADPPMRIDWVGTSMGGLIGMLLAAKPGSPIRRLVMNDVGPFVPWDSLIRLKGHVGNPGPFASPEDVAAHVRKACAPFGPFDDDWWHHLVEHAAEPLEDTGHRLRYDPGIIRGMPVHRDPELPVGPEFLRGIDLWSIWERVDCPVLVLRGSESEVLPAEVAHEMQKRRPNVTIREFPGVGHAPSLAVPDQIEAVTRFLLAPD